MHMVNHMGHYPLGAGPSRVDSLISECEDSLHVDADELSACIFNAPNVQVGLRFRVRHSFHSETAVLSLFILLWCVFNVEVSLWLNFFLGYVHIKPDKIENATSFSPDRPSCDNSRIISVTISSEQRFSVDSETIRERLCERRTFYPFS